MNGDWRVRHRRKLDEEKSKEDSRFSLIEWFREWTAEGQRRTYQERYRCHVRSCSFRSTKPIRGVIHASYDHATGAADLTQCKKCNLRVCEEHLDRQTGFCIDHTHPWHVQVLLRMRGEILRFVRAL
jgi:hypothetical protein